MSSGIREEMGKEIAGIKFGIFSPHEVRRMSVAEIETADTYDEDGAPITSGLMDGRLGTLEPRQRCKTCGNTAQSCPGHFGHIELAVPVVHVGFAKIVHELLTVTCRDCGRLLLGEDKIESYRERMREYLRTLNEVPLTFFDTVKKEAKRTAECPHCGRPQYAIEFVKPTTFHEALEGGGSVTLEPAAIRSRLERIPDDDLRLLGYDPSSGRPEWMVLQVLPVPPVYVRPSITLESGIRSEDDLTHKLVDIVRINQRLRECINSGAPTLIKEELSELLQYHVTTFLDNEAPGIPPSRHRSGRALKTLSQRLKGKEGRFRLNLSGKRVDFSARTVISPDPNLDIAEVGVPVDVARKLTVPERVTDFNLEEMRTLVRNGPDIYPGALYVIRSDGRRVRLEFVADRAKVAEAIQPGFTVERHLKNGDIVVFNRQPSLHRMSIMAHVVKVLPYKTFRLHPAVCIPYNADFDGDEMNLHVPQSEEARSEAKYLMQVQDQIVSPRYGAPIIGTGRDFLTAAYLLTKKETLLSKDEVAYLLAAAGYSGKLPEPAITRPEPLWRGRQVFSLFLPPDFNYTGRASVCKHRHASWREECPRDGIVVIRKGVLQRGVIDKNSIGAERPDSLYHRLVKDYGVAYARDFLNSLCKALTAFITMRGFSYAIDELKLTPEADAQIAEVLEQSRVATRQLIAAYEEGTLQRIPGKSLEESLDLYIMNELSNAREKCDRIAESCFGMENQGAVMTRVGARGSDLNIGHMTALLGQQAVRGKRVILGYSGRALPHFKWGDYSPVARGFIQSSFHKGLSPAEFFFHSMGGREGLVDTAVRTQQSGYMQRRLIHALEYLKVEYDGTVRDAEETIVQFKYGEDGVDPAKSDHGRALSIRRLVERLENEGPAGRPIQEKELDALLELGKERLPPLLIEQLRGRILEAKLSRLAAEQAVSTAIEEYERAQVEPGEASGIVAAQSIGEPGTQMTLRVFHFAGVKELDVTLGLPRLIEIVDARREPSTPTMTVRLDAEHRASRE
ncbi:MAG: DNA-directed RNA polymerase subunit A', partial [Candidatus Bathyarchaeia archaeon]